MAKLKYKGINSFKNEAELNSTAVKFINAMYAKHGVFVYKRTPGINNVGMPDITGSIGPSGRRIEIEGKRGDRTPTDMQEYYLKKFGRTGAIVGAYWCLEDIQLIFEHYKIKPVFIKDTNNYVNYLIRNGIKRTKNDLYIYQRIAK